MRDNKQEAAMNSKVHEAAAMIRQHWRHTPQAVVVLGTGLGQLARRFAAEVELPFGKIPGFARTTAISHRGCLLCGTHLGVPLILLEGRCHRYEGYSFREITLPVRVAQACGASTLIVTNASGGLNRYYLPGEIMIIDDHINLMQDLLTPREAQWSPLRVPRITPTCYDPQLADLALRVARHRSFVAHYGVYAAVTGPNYETRAEYSFLRSIGADVVGMSTVPEVEFAANAGMRILGLSVITNVAHIDKPEAVEAGHVITAAQRAEPHVSLIVDHVLQSI